MEINRYIEHTALKPSLTSDDVLKLIDEAKVCNFLGICVPPFWVKKAARELEDSDILVVTAIGFPLGYQMTETKIEEIDIAIKNGADEVDMVMNISAFKSGMPWAKIELAKCSHFVHRYKKLIKVIIETAHLSDDEISRACKMCVEAGVDFVKTSTGFAGEGAKVEHVKLMRETVPESIGIKAAGGIKTLKDAEAMLKAGATRLGTSSGVAIMSSKKS